MCSRPTTRVPSEHPGAGFRKSVKARERVAVTNGWLCIGVMVSCNPGVGFAHMSAPSAVVLIVEDDLLVRENAADMLESAGYVTLQARDAAEAIAMLESRTDIRVVFTDVEMPGSMDGLRLAALIRDRWPPVELIVTSGRMQPAAGVLPDRARFLPKPYSGSSLIGEIAPLLA